MRMFEPSKSYGVVMLRYWTDALHTLGAHEEELKVARWGRGIYPHLLNVHAYEARALAGLGRTEELEELIDDTLITPSQSAYPSRPRAMPAYVMLAAAEELRAHGRLEDSRKMAGRAVDWYRSRVGEEARQENIRSGLRDALYQAELWEEAQRVFTTLAAEHPDNVYYKGRLGTLAARRGDRVAARRIADELRRLASPDHTYSIACITVLLGDKEGAVALLREAVSQGGYDFIYRHSMDLESLRGYPPFADLVKPRG